MPIRFAPRKIPHAICPACSAVGLTAFYDVERIPTQSNLLLRTREEAFQQPFGDLHLALCNACGFITSVDFDPASQRLTSEYEATQGHSPTFGGFARSLTKRWAEQYQLEGKTVLEIGCGQGDFLEMLCEVAKCRGIGIDPVLAPARIQNAPEHLRLIPDLYTGQYADLPADFICCRHTLEHIHRPLEFLRMIRKCIGARSTPLCFEVPDTSRILREGAFWDLYYEHCSYFSAESLTRCFGLAGFDVQETRLEFGEQYLLIDAMPGQESTIKVHAEQVDILGAFTTKLESAIQKWDQLLAGELRVALWGSGSKAVGFLTTLGITSDRLPYVVDINPRKQGTYLPETGQQIVAPDQMREFKPDVVIIMNPAYVDEIGKALSAMNIQAELMPV